MRIEKIIDFILMRNLKINDYFNLDFKKRFYLRKKLNF